MKDYGKEAREVFNDLQDMVDKLARIAKKIEDELPYSYSVSDLDDRFMLDQLKNLGRPLSQLVYGVKYTGRSIAHEGVLRLGRNGRYWIGDAVELTSGSPVEILITDDEDGDFWKATRIEHSDEQGGYYAFHFPKQRLEGIRARVRRSGFFD